MVRKILPIVFDQTNRLSKELTILGKSHIYCQKDDKETYQMLSNGIYKYIDKFFITETDECVDRVLKDFVGYNVIRIATNTNQLTKKFPISVEIFQSINEPIFRYIAEGTFFYTSREIRNITTDREIMRKTNLTIILAGKTSGQQSLSNLRKILDTIRHNRIMSSSSESFLIERIRTIYCGEKKDFLSNFLMVDKSIDLMPVDLSDPYQLTNYIQHSKRYDLINRDKYYYFWRGLNEAMNAIDPTDNIVMTLDINQLDPLCKEISIEKQIIDIMENDSVEKIFVNYDQFAIGTYLVMRYMMMMSEYYGMYSFKNSCRTLLGDGVLTREEYQNMPKGMNLRSDLQLFEHLNHFTDLKMCLIRPYQLIGKQIVQTKKIDSIELDVPHLGRMIDLRKKKHLILVTYYGIYEQFVYVADILEKLGYTVHDYPYNKYLNENGLENAVNIFIRLIEEVNPMYCLWWTIKMDSNNMYKVVNSNKQTKHLYFNWDEPYNWDLVDAKNKARYLDMAFVCCSETTSRYVQTGTRYAYCLYPGYSPKLHKPVNNLDKIYIHDVSFIATNLYEDPVEYPNQLVSRKKIVDILYSNQKSMGYSFAIYGSDEFKDIYPDSYKGFVKYDDTPTIINGSKINICTHVVGNKKGYLNERVFLVMGCGGLLLVDPVPQGDEQILINGENCVMIDQNRILAQVKNILANYPKYERIKINAYKTMANYTWDDWGMQIEEKLLRAYS